MGKGSPRYYRVKRKKAFWEPTPAMRKAGFQSVPLGDDGPAAFKAAEEWNRRWDAARSGQDIRLPDLSGKPLSVEEAEAMTAYPSSSLGAAFKRYRATTVWAAKASRTREEWWRAWQWIKPVFGDVDPRTVTLEDISAWRDTVAETVSVAEAFRAQKIWRALWKVSAALHFCEREADPSLGVPNRAPKGRSESWSEGEAVQLFKRAWRMRYRGLAAVIAVAWDTQLSPGDIRSLRASQLVQAGSGAVFFTERGKTGTPVGGALSARTLRALAAYLEDLGVELHDEAFIFRNRSGEHYLKNALAEDFRSVRVAQFGENEKRKLGWDFRRSGAIEAIAGEASSEALAHAMGNTLSASNALFATYVPVNLATIKSVVLARREGRNRVRDANESGSRVGTWRPGKSEQRPKAAAK